MKKEVHKAIEKKDIKDPSLQSIHLCETVDSHQNSHIP
jgi:ribosome-binding factor A